MNIYESISKIVAEIPAIKKEKVNSQQNFKFRGIDDVMNALHPLLAKNKVFVVPQIIEQIREERKTTKGTNLIYSICKIKYSFYAEDGTSIDAITIGEGMDSGDKATNKAMAIAMKYALFQVFCIPTDEILDPDAETPEESIPLIDSKVEKSLREKISNLGLSNEEVIKALKSLKHSKLNELTYDEVERFIKIIEKNAEVNNE